MARLGFVMGISHSGLPRLLLLCHVLYTRSPQVCKLEIQEQMIPDSFFCMSYSWETEDALGTKLSESFGWDSSHLGCKKREAKKRLLLRAQGHERQKYEQVLKHLIPS